MKAVKCDYIKLTLEGHTKKHLKCVGLKSECGQIKDGIAFAFDGDGGWVLDYNELVELVLVAARYRLDEAKKKK